MSPATPMAATLDDLYRVKGKAELIGGRVVHFMPTGRRPSRIVARIFRSLDDHAEATGRGEAYTDNTGFVVPVLSSGRQSFSCTFREQRIVRRLSRWPEVSAQLR